MKRLIFFIALAFISDFATGQTTSFEWVRQFGGPLSDHATGIALDASGNIHVTGRFIKTVDFNPGSGIFNLSSKDSTNDVFILKLDPSGNMIWAKKVGGTRNDLGMAIAVDGSGNVYTTGRYGGYADTVDFDPGPDSFKLATRKGSQDIFILKLDAGGNFVWAKSIGGRDDELANSIVVDGDGKVYLTGSFNDTVDFDPGADTFALVAEAGGEADAFILNLDGAGNFLWARDIGINGRAEDCTGISVDKDGNVFTAGRFFGTVDFDPGGGTSNLTANGTDVFILKLDASGNFKWARHVGGSLQDLVHALAVDASGNVYTTGRFTGTADFDPGAGTLNLTSTGEDIFVLKLDANGYLLWAKGVGGPSSDLGMCMALDLWGNPYISGAFRGAVDFDPGPATYNLVASDFADIFILKLDINGNFRSAQQMGGVDYDFGYAIGVDNFGNVYTTGRFGETVDFNPGAGKFELKSNGGDDIFVMKMGQNMSGLPSEMSVSALKIYPNPGNAVFNFAFHGMSDNRCIEIYNSLGVLICLAESTSEMASMDLSQQANGLYVAKVTESNGLVMIRQFVITR